MTIFGGYLLFSFWLSVVVAQYCTKWAQHIRYLEVYVHNHLYLNAPDVLLQISRVIHRRLDPQTIKQNKATISLQISTIRFAEYTVA